MPKLHMMVAVVSVVVGLATAFAVTRSLPGNEQPKPEPIELTGLLHRPAKWSPQLDMGVSGHIRYFDLEGKLLQDIPDGTPIRVKGVVRSRFFSAEGQSPFPAQWIISLYVTELEILANRESVRLPATTQPTTDNKP